MADSISEFLTEFDFREFRDILFEGDYFEFLFPFLLAFALIYTVITSERVNLIRTENNGLNKAAAFMIAFVVSYMGTSFETSPGMNVGKLLMLMFPNISALTIGFLTLYIVGAIFGKDFFASMFDKRSNAFLYITMGAIGLGAVVFYTGIAFGTWDLDPLDQGSYWNVVLGTAFLLLGVTLMVVGSVGFGILILSVLGIYIYNFDDSSILDHFLDPIVFMFFIIILVSTWLGTDPDSKRRMRKDIADGELSELRYRNLYGGKAPKPNNSRLYDIGSEVQKSRKKRWKKDFPDEDY